MIILCANIKKMRLKYIVGLTKIDISSTNKVDIEKGEFCFFVCVMVEEKL